MEKPIVYAVVGPTASGKTSAVLALAGRANVEIVCMDSMQVYVGMDIGTAKPTKLERAQLPHHMLDVASPKAPFSVTEYAERAHACIREIHARGRIPVLCGGTGLYLRALSLPLTFGGAPGDAAVRAKYQAYADTHGKPALHALLAERDPETAARLHENDVRRVVRALEVWEVTGVPFSAQKPPSAADSPYTFRLYGVDVPRETLRARIDARVDDMLQGGLLAEVAGLLASGVPEDAQSMQGLGYKELIPVVRGEAPLADAADLLKTRTKQYAKRQMTWFRADARIAWRARETITEAIIHDIQAD